LSHRRLIRIDDNLGLQSPKTNEKGATAISGLQPGTGDALAALMGEMAPAGEYVFHAAQAGYKPVTKTVQVEPATAGTPRARKQASTAEDGTRTLTIRKLEDCQPPWLARGSRIAKSHRKEDESFADFCQECKDARKPIAPAGFPAIIRGRMAKTKPSLWTDTVSLLAPPPPGRDEHYFFVTQRPWPSLLFILPMLVFFEVGSYLRQGGTSGASSQLVATYLIDVMVNSFGRTAFYLPGLLAVVILLTTHIVGRYPWRFDVYVLAGMLGESLIWTLPLFVSNRVLVLQTAVRSTQDTGRSEWINEVIRSFGAGLYEELVFRLICMTALSILLVNVCRLPRSASAVCIVLISAGLFAAQHHYPLGAEPFKASVFVFRTIAGIYLAGLFLCRGFGIACGCHAFYNLIIVTIRAI
jgi:membrane protease YdiL (CAAX protease family)